MSPSKIKPFFWEIFPKCGWVGWLIPKQGPNPSKPPQITPKIAFFDPNFTFPFLKSHKNPGVGGWVNTFGRDLQKNGIFWGGSPKEKINSNVDSFNNFFFRKKSNPNLIHYRNFCCIQFTKYSFNSKRNVSEPLPERDQSTLSFIC